MGTCKLLQVFFALIFCFPVSAQQRSAQTALDSYIVDKLLNSSVRIQSDSSSGFGFIFGRTGDVLWVATAAHVIFPDSPHVPAPAASNIRVRLRGLPKVFELAEPAVKAQHDIAFLGVHAPRIETASLFWNRQVEADSIEFDQPLRIAGYEHRIEYSPAATGKVGGSPDAPEIEIQLGQSGQSGAAVVSNRGIVGMYQRSGGFGAIRIGEIRKAALAAGKPWQLTAAPLPPASVRLCLSLSAGNSVLPVLNGPEGIVELESDSCVRTSSGLIVLVAPDRYMTCEPSSLELPRAPSLQKLSVGCRTDPSGVWESQTGGFVKISGRDNLWNIEGFKTSSYGILKGLMEGRAPRVKVTMRDQYGAVATGTLTLEPQRLYGTLQMGLQSIDVNLER